MSQYIYNGAYESEQNAELADLTKTNDLLGLEIVVCLRQVKAFNAATDPDVTAFSIYT